METKCEKPTYTSQSTDGPKIYQQFCAACHGASGRPDAAMVARLGVRDLSAPAMRARMSVALVVNQVRKGSQNKLMPSFDGALCSRP